MAIAEMFVWWYSRGWRVFVASLKNWFMGVADFFSMDSLIRTLFKPYRQISAGTSSSGSLDLKFQMFDNILRKIFKEEYYIIEGNYQRTIEMRLKECDTAILLDFPQKDCLEGAKSRIGKKRIDLPWVETELDPNFEQKIIDFSEEKLPKIYKLLDKYKEGKEIVILKSREEANKYLDKLAKNNKKILKKV